MKYLKCFVNVILIVTLAAGLISCSGSKPDDGGPNAKTGALVKPAKTGNAKIDGFVDETFSLLEEVQNMKEGLAEINATITEINNHPVGPFEWMKEDIMRSVAKAKDAAKQLDPDALVKALQGKIYGMVESAKKTKDGLENIQTTAKSLLKTLPELPAEAGSLGMKAPKALKAIKATGAPLKAIPEEVKALATEAQKVLENCDKLLKSIGN
jgi:uncharacterized coiled-coil DUF342 family protein